MSKEYIEEEELIDDTYGQDSNPIELFDDVEAVEELESKNDNIDFGADDSPEIYNDDLIEYLDSQLSLKNESTRQVISVKDIETNNKYNLIVMGKSKTYTNRYVFKNLTDDVLVAFWVNKLVLI